MISSKILNRAEPTLLGWPKKRSLKAGVLGLTFIVVVYAFIQSMNFTTWLFIGLFFFWVPLLFSEWLFGRNEEWTNKRLEKILVSLKLAGGKKGTVSAENLGLTNMFYDNDSVYTLNGFEYFGFEYNASMSTLELHNEAIKILKDMPVSYVVKFIRFNSIYKSKFIQNHRSALCKQELIKPGYYIIFARNVIQTKESDKMSFLEEIPTTCRRLRETELKQYNEFLFNPTNIPKSDHKKALFTASHQTDGKFSWVYPNECYGACSLVELPDEVDKDFYQFFEAFEGSVGFVMARFEKHSQQAEEVKQAFKTFKLIQSRAALYLSRDSVKSEKIRKNLEDRTRGYGANLKMFVNCLVYGRPEEVTKRLKKIGRSDKATALTRPTFQVDSGHIDRSVASLAVGRKDTLPLREQKLDSIEEAVFYIPPKIHYIEPEIEYPFCFRNKNNVPRYIDHANLEVTPITLLVGKSGYGKSLTLSQMITAHLLLEKIYKRPVAVIMGEAGGSAKWLKYNGTADLTMDLSRQDGMDYNPLPIHPLHVFLEPYSTNKTDLKVVDALPARNFIASLIGTDFLDDEANKIIFNAIVDIYHQERTYEISKFYSYLDRAKNQQLKSVPESGREEFEVNWYKRLTKLSQYCKGGAYNHIFEPQDPEYDSINHVRVFYYNLDEEDFNNPDLVKPFLNLCYSTSQQISIRFKSTNKEGRDVLECIDEFDKQAKYLPISSLKDKKDQARKYGQIPTLCIQSFDYLSRKNEHGDYDNSIYEGVGRTIFWQVGQESVYPKVAAIFDEPYFPGKPGPKLSQMLEIAKSINDQKKMRDQGLLDSNMPRPMGFFDTNKIIEELINDVEDDYLWEKTTKPGGRYIRNFIIEKMGLSLEEASKFLARKLGNKIPSATPSEEWLNNLIGD